MTSLGAPTELDREAVERLVSIIAEQADNAPFNLGAKGYLQLQIGKTHWSKRSKRQRANGLTGDPEFDARSLIAWANDHGTLQGDRRYTALGSLLQILMAEVGWEDAQWMAAQIRSHNLFRDRQLLDDLMMRYRIPWSVNEFYEEGYDLGPDFDWQGPTETTELQFWGKPEPDLQDVGFLMRAIESAASVCRVEINSVQQQGTGFLVAPRLLLTNYHVLAPNAGADPREVAGDVLLRFGNVTAADGEEKEGVTFRLDGQEPVVKSSPVEELDYVLLRVEESIRGHESIRPAPFSLAAPYKGMSINILQHPAGRPLQLALCGSGVDKLIPERGLVQYSTKAFGGSSGAPCFDDDWQVVALHHAQKARSFGSVREGIVFEAIHQEINELLP